METLLFSDGLPTERRVGRHSHRAEQGPKCQGEPTFSAVAPSINPCRYKKNPSVKPVSRSEVVAKKRRDRGLPRAFEIFTDDKTYVLKAQDEKHAEEWLQCINVAVAQARERENREATTYL